MSLFAKELWELRYRLTVMFVLIIVAGIFILGYYELFQKSVDIAQIEWGIRNSILSNFINPEVIIRQIDELTSNIDLYVWSQWFGKNFMQLILLSTILLGFSSFARETEHETNSFLLTNFTRAQAFWTKIYAGTVSLVIIVGLGCLVPAIIALFKPFQFNLIMSLQYFIQILPAALCLYALIILFSVLAKDVVKPIILGIATMILLSLTSHIPLFKGLYIYRYLTGADIFIHNQISVLAVIIISIMAMAVLFLARHLYMTKDF